MSKVKKRSWLFFILVSALAFGVGIGLSLNKQPLTPDWSDQLNRIFGQQIPDFTLRDIDGNLRGTKEWQGQIVVLNFWATWCPPCREEMPMFEALYNEYADKQMTIIGLAVDNLDDVKQFVAENNISYPILIGDADSMDMARELGNSAGGLPYTVVFDRSGELAEILLGEVEREQLVQILNKLTSS